MRPAVTYTIRPLPPESLAFLSELSYNLWWSWQHPAIDLFRSIDPDIWEQVEHNPIRLLGRVSQPRLDELAHSHEFLERLAGVESAFRAYMSEPRWFQREHSEASETIAYFSMEYGLARTLPVYSGGLGILSGDHMKCASDLGAPLVGVGLAYRQGYFRQYLNIDGWQQQRYEENDFHHMPIEAVRSADGERVVLEVPYCGSGGEGRSVRAFIWRVNVGRIPLYLLSTNHPDNSHEDRQLTAQLYGGDRELRIRQEIALGIGGLRLLRLLGIKPGAVHMNEGHSAFLGLERIRELMDEDGLSFQEAYELVFTSTVFTTHTPVPAGNDVFEAELVTRYLDPLANELGLDEAGLLALGRSGGDDGASGFTMPVLALKTSAFSNGVSKLHATISRGMWQAIWPELPVDEVPITAVTNGVHLYTWTAKQFGELYDHYIGPEWRSDPLQPELWSKVYDIPNEELWRTHSHRRARLVMFARRRLARQLEARGAPVSEVKAAESSLDPQALTVGFGRRFATYKRATLLIGELARLRCLLENCERPVQFIFAGKAHPHDDSGKGYIREIVHASRQAGLLGRLVFLEDYDMQVARYMVQGCDVWLNNPRRPLEASGTSGMKAVLNGGLHCSTLDGWWDQAYSRDVGWAIGAGELYDDVDEQDRIESDALFELLEHDIAPLFFARGDDGLPHEWIGKMKNSMANLIPRFCADRMLRGYIDDAYLPAVQRYQQLSAHGYAAARELAQWRQRVKAAWGGVEIAQLEVRPTVLVGTAELAANEPVEARATLALNGLDGDDVLVEAYSGLVDNQDNFRSAVGIPMEYDSDNEAGQPRFCAKIASEQSGHFGLTVRVFPKHASLPHKYALFTVKWN
jgi:glycogen phosphorylase